MKLCKYCGKGFKPGETYLNLWSYAFAAHHTGYAHIDCHEEAEWKRDRRFMIFVSVVLAVICLGLSFAGLFGSI